MNINWKLCRNSYAFAAIILVIIAFVFESRDYHMAFLICILIAIFSGFSVYFTNKYAEEEKAWNEAKSMIESGNPTIYMEGSPVEDDFNFDAISSDYYSVRIDGNYIYLRHRRRMR